MRGLEKEGALGRRRDTTLSEGESLKERGRESGGARGGADRLVCADAGVIEDARFKRKEALADLEKAVSKA